MLKISIPTPCHEDWDAMTPNTQGRHCNSCVKTVVDFTNMSDEDVKYFFLNKSEEKVCGRFRTEQLQRITIELPENIFYLQLPFWKKFLAACLIVFSTTLFSCEIKLTGDVAATYTKTILKDSATMGKPMAPKLETDTAHKPIPKTCTVIQGDSIPELYNVVGILEIPVPPEEKKEIIEVIPADTSTTNKLQFKKGEVSIIAKDSLQTKNPPKADSSNCN